jgi:uncharacterized protein (UPF0332 family)
MACQRLNFSAFQHTGDYREQIALTMEQVEPYLEQAKNFIGAVRSYLATSRCI